MQHKSYAFQVGNMRTKWFWNWIFEVRLKMGFRYQGSASVNIDLCFKWSFWFGGWLIWWSWWTDRKADWAPSAVVVKLMWGLFFPTWVLQVSQEPASEFFLHVMIRIGRCKCWCVPPFVRWCATLNWRRWCDLRRWECLLLLLTS